MGPDPSTGFDPSQDATEESLQRLEDLTKTTRSRPKHARSAKPAKAAKTAGAAKASEPKKSSRSSRKRSTAPQQTSVADQTLDPVGVPGAYVEHRTLRSVDRGGVSPARLAAPVVFVIAVIIVIALALGSGGKTTPRKAPTPGGKKAATATATATTSPSPDVSATASTKTYTIKPGDTLSGIADRLKLQLSEIEDLNPNVDWNNLQPGQRLKLPE